MIHGFSKTMPTFIASSSFENKRNTQLTPDRREFIERCYTPCTERCPLSPILNDVRKSVSS